MIFNGIKRRWLRKELQKLQKEQVRPSIKWPQSLVVIYDGQQVSDISPFLKWAEELGIKKDAVTCIAYVNDKKKSTITDAHLIDRKLIKWSGGITDSETKELLSKTFDLQINHFNTENDLIDYVSLALPSGLKVAYGSDNESLFDLSISVDLKDYKGLIIELKKYLKILTQ
ncbi:hypothetical protein JCM19275_1955 [Nonlabens ulvanivorans]|uniref:Uncharacterized protein n=1 Tax=Nonlabens ulvanivorans TaxID=906888 RepID=A0A090WJE9_NONUL|nr:hypothetical protein [Nonlabens ulvanivorans]GAL75504.1 hypothetical protein JCM19275_1955 [Nonlabens ulvanivorans]